MVEKFLWLLPGYPPPPVKYRRAGYLGGTSSWCPTCDSMLLVSCEIFQLEFLPGQFLETYT